MRSEYSIVRYYLLTYGVLTHCQLCIKPYAIGDGVDNNQSNDVRRTGVTFNF